MNVCSPKYRDLTPFTPGETLLEPSMAVGALGRPPAGRPRGRLVAPDGSPPPPKCEL